MRSVYGKGKPAGPKNVPAELAQSSSSKALQRQRPTTRRMDENGTGGMAHAETNGNQKRRKRRSTRKPSGNSAVQGASLPHTAQSGVHCATIASRRQPLVLSDPRSMAEPFPPPHRGRRACAPNLPAKATWGPSPPSHWCHQQNPSPSPTTCQGPASVPH